MSHICAVCFVCVCVYVHVCAEEGGYATVEEEFWTQREKEAQSK